MLEKLYGPVDAVDGDFAGEDLLLAAVGADDEPAVASTSMAVPLPVPPPGRSKVTWRPRFDAGRLVLVPEGSEAIPREGVERTVKAEVCQRLGQPLGVGGKVHFRALQLEGGAVGQFAASK